MGGSVCLVIYDTQFAPVWINKTVLISKLHINYLNKRTFNEFYKKFAN